MVWFGLLMACGGATPPPEAAVRAATPEDPVVVTWKDGQLTLSEVESGVASKLAAMKQEYQLQRYELTRRAMDGAIDDAILEAEAKKAGIDVETLLRNEIESKVVPPTDAQLRSFYEEVKDQLRGARFDAVQTMLAGELMNRQMAGRYDVYVTQLRESAGVKASLPYPDLERLDVAVSDTDPRLGSADAPVTIVQFAEYQCYYCNKVQPTLDALVADYDGKVSLVYKDFPLENHPRAFPAAVAARCAGEQDKYWEMSGRMLANQSALSDADLLQHADELGLDRKKFDSCLTEPEISKRVADSFAQGQALGVAATPTFYVNGVLVSGAQPYDQFKAIIDRELQTTP